MRERVVIAKTYQFLKH